MLTPWKESYDQPRQHIKKQRHYFVNKGLSLKAVVFPVIMHGCEGWTIKKAECRIDGFELWCWRRLLTVPWTARRSDQSILKEISLEYSLERLMLKLKLQYFGTSPPQWRWVWVNSGSWWWTGRPGVLWFKGSQRVGHDWATELNWTGGIDGILFF